MSLKNVPTEEEEMEWNSKTLSDYMKKDNENVYEKPDQNDGSVGAFSKFQTTEKTCSVTIMKSNRALQSYTCPKESPLLELQNPIQIQDCHTALYSDLKLEKIKKPDLPCSSSRHTTKSKGSFVIPFMPKQLVPHMPSRMDRPSTYVEMKTQFSEILEESKHNRDTDLNPRWYRGKMSRCQAESVLREVNKDGAFLVRDSSTDSTDHLYTLMILNKGKIYNIKIRNQGDSYMLGSGLRNNQSYPGVRAIINHHTHNPLLLIDGRDQYTKDYPQCCLLHPVGL